MRQQVIKVSYYKAQYEVIHDDGEKINPFRVYQIRYVWSSQGRKRKRKQVARYADLTSCLFYLYNNVSRNHTTEEAIIDETYKRR